ncbi:hypothetical protein [Paludisphaera rhizosphaerae]|uniref:hypothetical protein n=1 Tax=Paludisphaera rhizosphaerae TaxID=2711216 RepID=UPI0013EBADD0|nr:hypothetical protein [Paludisphaera rhizosphaerae]
MPHPQHQEIEEHVRRLFYLPDNAISLPRDELMPLVEKAFHIYAPESRVRISLYGNVDYPPESGRLVRTAFMHFDWPAAGERERIIAEKLGLPPPEWKTVQRLRIDTKGPWQRRDLQSGKRQREYEAVQVPPYAICAVKDADQAVNLCLAVLEEVFGIPDSQWLWVTDLPDNQDQWPVSLTRPEQWPSAFEWPPNY